jgi:hypothetical protein
MLLESRGWPWLQSWKAFSFLTNASSRKWSRQSRSDTRPGGINLAHPGRVQLPNTSAFIDAPHASLGLSSRQGGIYHKSRGAKRDARKMQ